MGWHSTRDWITSERSRLRYRILPTVLASLVFDPPPDPETHERVRADVTDAYSEIEETLGDDIRAFCDAATPAIELDDFPTAIEEYTDALDRFDAEVRDRREQLEAAARESMDENDTSRRPPASLPDAYLTDEERRTFERLERRIETTATHLRQAAIVANRLPEIEASVDDLRPTIEELERYERYLPTREGAQLRSDLDAVEATLSDLLGDVDTDVLPAEQADRLREITEWIERSRSFLTGYNEGGPNHPGEGFVSHRIDAKETLFTDVDEAGHDLNTDQRKAVVRNERFNQVIAAAGTGKTLVLTFRVAYLVNELGVDPERIVCLTYTNEATTEMSRRLDEQFDIQEVQVQTIHAFGYGIATEEADRYIDAVGDEDRMTFVRSTIREETATSDSTFKTQYKRYLFYHDHDPVLEKDFETKEKYYEARKATDYETLRGEMVASFAEKMIADFLFRNQVTYEHEALAEWADTAEDKRSYRPDFYLPEYDLYIEHWGIDEQATVPEWFTGGTEWYLEKLHWARSQYREPDAPDLIDTYEFEHQAGFLESALEHRLSVHDVELEELSYEQLIETVYDYNRIEGVIHQKFSSFVRNAKVFGISPDDVASNLSTENKRQYHFGLAGRELLFDYEEWLDSTGQIDFSEMISRAENALASNLRQYQDRFDHVLVDEFQDVSKSQIRLLRLLTDGETGPTLFCVGDDWQSIYSFQGSEVEFFVNFSEYFPDPAITVLETNYRNPPAVIDAGNDLIAENDEQIEKSVAAAKDLQSQPTLHAITGRNVEEYNRYVGEYTAGLVADYLEGWQPSDPDPDRRPADVMVLCHLDNGAPYLDRVKKHLRDREIPYQGKEDSYVPSEMADPADAEDEWGVSVFSMHQSKGKEAEHVVIVHAAGDENFGIPFERDDELLAPVKPIQTNSVAEYRRLFYVGLTRAERTLDVLTIPTERSRFVDEIDEHLVERTTLPALGDVERDRVTVRVHVDSIATEPGSKKHQQGRLSGYIGNGLSFVIWDDESTSLPTLSENQWYEIDGARRSEYRGSIELVLDAETDITELAEPPSMRESRPETVLVERTYSTVPDQMCQKGELRSWSGRTYRFYSWNTDESEPDPPTLEPGTWYELSGFDLTEYEGSLEYRLTTETDVREIEPPEKVAEVAAVFDDVGEKFLQKGTLQLPDETVPFVIWGDTDTDTLVEDGLYDLRDFRFNHYGGRRELVIRDETTVRRLDRDG